MSTPTNSLPSQCHNILLEPLISATIRNGQTDHYNLPQILHELYQTDRIVAFNHLQAHLWPAWYVFLVQLAALATLENDTPVSESHWRKCLRTLTRMTDDHPWCLAVPDLQRSAFMQPPVPEGRLDDFKGPYAYPDHGNFDILINSENHDIKTGRQIQASPDHWIFALVACQTHSGYSGSGNWGIIRMNGGHASRPLVGLAPDKAWGACFRRDLAVLRETHRKHAAGNRQSLQQCHKLLWLHPWDGRTSIPWTECDPYAIEVARRVRLCSDNGAIAAFHAPAKAPRLSPKSQVLKGNVGDPWIPISGDGAAVTIGSRGWDYKRLQRILFQDECTWSACQIPRDRDPDELWLYAVSLARGRGKTEGFHERWVHIPGSISELLRSPDSLEHLKRVARERVKAVSRVRGMLRRSLLVLLKGGSRLQSSSPDLHPHGWIDRFESRIDAEFFPRLWEDSMRDPQTQRQRWASLLREIVEDDIWPRAEREVPLKEVRRERALSLAWIQLRQQLKRELPEAFAFQRDSSPCTLWTT